MDQDFANEVKKHNEKLAKVKNEVQKGITGQKETVNSVLKCIICGGHVLLESVPGLAKTLLVRLISETIDGASFQRIQFTPDLLPTDITGTTVYEKKRGFYTVKGPIFANFVLGDEINRAPPKVQSSMLQAMQEKQVTIGKETFDLPKPFVVLATQNPLEQRGVYPLPFAQIDRFLFKVYVTYPSDEEEFIILNNNSVIKTIAEFELEKVLHTKELLAIQECVKKIQVSEEVKQYIVDLVDATRYPAKYEIKGGRYMDWGGSPRASINLALSARANAMMSNRTFVVPEDVRSIAHNVLRHRVGLNYEGKARNISTDEIIDDIIRNVPVI
ncbi:MAG: ATPase [Candidatus Altiarchaeales archaeon ex4484_96]|nr:MAG: ATPase [Candidatus Altiarchaeales archaeon ex4484_96]